jgi:predicted heme/steroid binding protein
MADHLNANDSLVRNQSRSSSNGIYELIFQGDSNLVLYKKYPSRPARALWASNTVGSAATVCVMQGDGNLVLYDAANRPIWSSGTHGNPGSRLVVQDDGNTVIYRSNDSASWATNTVQQAVPNGPTATGDGMSSGQVLHKGNSLSSSNGTYLWIFQGDGNLVLYKRYPNRPDRALWASNTHGSLAWVCIMQGDGNLVIYDVDGKALWASGTHGNPGSRFVIQSDGNGVIYRPNNSAAWATNTVQRTVPNGPTASGADMQPGEVLHLGNSLTSANGTYLWVFQQDGNLVLYKRYPSHPTRALWSSNTHGKPAWVCIMQGDGNLVIYDIDGNPLWSSGTHGNPGSRFVMQDDGNGVIYRANGSASWATNTVQRNVPNGPTANGADMQPGEVLRPGNSIRSPNGNYLWIFQGDGNLVLYKTFATAPNAPLWASDTHGKPAWVCIMQGDGNLVIYDIDGNPLWSSGTHGNPGSRFVMQDDGNGVIYRPDDAPLWATRTHGARIHFKTLVSLTNAVRTYIAAQFADMDELFAGGRVNVVMGTIEDLSADATLAAVVDLNVGGCTRGNPTSEHDTLFARRNNVTGNELVVYVVRSIQGGSGNVVGCATHPAGQPGCAIIQGNARWLTAHEIGHVFGLTHVDDTNRLMNPNTGWTNLPPDLSGDEYARMRDSDLTP